MSEEGKAELKLDTVSMSQEDAEVTRTQDMKALDDSDGEQNPDVQEAAKGGGGDTGEASSIPAADGSQDAPTGRSEGAGVKAQPRETTTGSISHEPGAFRVTPGRPASPDSLTDEREDDGPLPQGTASASEPPPPQDSPQPGLAAESTSDSAPVVLQAVVVNDDPGSSRRSRSGSDKALLVEGRPEYPSRRRMWLTLFGLLTLGAVVGISVGVTQGRAPSSSSSSESQSSAPTPFPTMSPTSTAIMKEFLSGLPDTTRAEIESNPSSPQAQAFLWLSSADRPSTTDVERLKQRLGLATLYYATKGESWLRNDGWLNGTISECEWFGCTCSTLNDTVQSLLIDDNNLTGTIPPEIGFLTGLDNLGLYSNHLRGTLPTEIGHLTLMLNLFISGNEELTGPLPVELARLESMMTLILPNCALTGEIPTQLGTLTNLVWLALSNNTLQSTIPTELGRLTALETLYIEGNLLEGTIPSEIAGLPFLYDVSVKNNSLSGRIPTDWVAVESLTYLYLNNNDLTGSVPTELGNIQFLEELYLQQNDITGSIPDNLCPLVDNGNLQIRVDCREVTCACCLCS